MNFPEIPKVELHCHLEACFRPGTVMEIGKSLDLDIPQDVQRFHDDWLLSRPLQDLETALKRFADIQKLWCSEEIIERLTFEACEDAVAQGIHIINDPAAMDIVRQRNVALEVCPTSNYLTSSVSSTAEHPIRRLMESGIPLTINSDDPGLFGIDLCHEYEILRRDHGFSIDDFDRCNDIAAAQSFLPLEQKRRVWPREIDAANIGISNDLEPA